MGMPYQVRVAYERGDQDALRKMREKAARTRAENLRWRKEEATRLQDEQLAAEDWYRERFEEEMLRTDPFLQRQDDLLPDDDLPF